MTRTSRIPRRIPRRFAGRAPVLAAVYAVALALLPLQLEGQVLEPGVRVRVTQANGFRQQGTFQGFEADSARLIAARGEAVVIPLSEVARMEISTGRHRRFWKNFGLTTAGAALLGGGIAASTYDPCNEEVLFGCLLSPSSRTEAFMWGAVAGGMLGVPVGLVVGAAVRQERWAPVFHREAASRVSIRPVLGRGVGAAAALTFE